MVAPAGAQELTEEEIQAAVSEAEQGVLAFEQLLATGAELDDERILRAIRDARILQDFGRSRLARSSYWDALELVVQFAELHPDPDTRRQYLLHARSLRAQVRQYEGRVDEALVEYGKALRHAADESTRSMVRIRIAELHRYRKAWSRAVEELQLARRGLSAASADEPLRLPMRVDEAVVATQLELDLGRLDLAWHHLGRARRILHEHPQLAERQPELPINLRLLSIRVDLTADFLEAAIRTAEEVLDDPAADAAQRAAARSMLGTARLAQACRRTTLDADAMERLRTDGFTALSEGRLAPDERELITLRLAELALVRGELREARSRLDAASVMDTDPIEVRSLRGTLESRLALARGAPSAVLRDQRARLLDLQRELLATWDAARCTGRVGFLHYPLRRALLAALIEIEQTLDAADVGSALAHVLDVQARDSLTGTIGSGAPDLARIQRELEPDTLLLVYLFAAPRSYVFAIGPGDAGVAALADSRVLWEPVRDFGQRFATPPPGDAARFQRHRTRVREDAEALGEALLPEAFRPGLRSAARVVVVGAEQLELFPFESLRVDGRWLGTWKAIEHWPSIAFGLALGRRTQRRRSEPAATAPRRALLLAAPDPLPGEDRTRLSLTDERQDELRAAWPELDLRRGPAASERALRGLDLGRLDALLFVGHGCFDEARELPAGILLSPTGERAREDGRLWCDDVIALAPAPPLVVLAACETGRGHQRRGESAATHMGGAWLRAGSRAVVQSPFPIEERSAYALVAELGRGLEAGLGTSEALRRARASLARERDHPFYFGTLRLVGHGR